MLSGSSFRVARHSSGRLREWDEPLVGLGCILSMVVSPNQLFGAVHVTALHIQREIGHVAISNDAALAAMDNEHRTAGIVTER
jgi:hypothetical protein